jgi:hypothetical protein
MSQAKNRQSSTYAKILCTFWALSCKNCFTTTKFQPRKHDFDLYKGFIMEKLAQFVIRFQRKTSKSLIFLISSCS